MYKISLERREAKNFLSLFPWYTTENPGPGGCEQKKPLSLSHEMSLMLICWIYPMIATTGSDAVLYPILYVCYETRLSQQTHTLHSALEGWKRAKNSLLGLRLITSDAGTGRFIPHRDDVHIAHRWTRPAGDDSALRSLADDSACSSFDALFSTNTHLSFFLLFTAQHDSMFFRFFLYDSSRLYWIQEKNLCCYYLKSFFFACKSCDFWGEGEELQRFYFSLLLRVLLTTIWQWESQKQFLVWWNPADRQLDIILPHVCLGRVRCDFCPLLIQLE